MILKQAMEIVSWSVCGGGMYNIIHNDKHIRYYIIIIKFYVTVLYSAGRGVARNFRYAYDTTIRIINSIAKLENLMIMWGTN